MFHKRDLDPILRQTTYIRNIRKNIKMYSKSQPVQLVFIKKLLTPCLKLETLGADLTITAS